MFGAGHSNLIVEYFVFLDGWLNVVKLVPADYLTNDSDVGDLRWH